MAPEVVNQATYEGPAVDVFACGVMLFMMLSGKPPFSEHCDDFHKYLLSNPRDCCERRKINISDEALELSVAMLQIDPKKRISMEGVFNHAFTQGKQAEQGEVSELFDMHCAKFEEEANAKYA